MGITAMIAMTAASAGTAAYSQASKPKLPGIETPPIPDPAQDERDAQKSAKKRRDIYANVGRSSTILTGPGGIEAAPADSTAPKSLLGL